MSRQQAECPLGLITDGKNFAHGRKIHQSR
jgi:hypothetical protein